MTCNKYQMIDFIFKLKKLKSVKIDKKYFEKNFFLK